MARGRLGLLVPGPADRGADAVARRSRRRARGGRLAHRARRAHRAHPARARCPAPNGAVALARRQARTTRCGRASPRRRCRSRSTSATAATTASPRRGAAAARSASATATRSRRSSCPTAPIHDTIASLVVHGVFKRHPTLRVASIENGSDWMALLVKRLRKQANQTPWVFAEDPLDTIRRHVWVTPYYEEDFRKLADLIGVERILFGSDWPHGEGLAEPLDFVEGARRLLRGRGAQDHARQLPRAARTRPVERPHRAGDGRRSAGAARRGRSAGSTSTGTPTSSVDEWWRLVADAGWTAPHFAPEQGGRGLPAARPGHRARRVRGTTARCGRPAASACSWPRRRSSRTARPTRSRGSCRRSSTARSAGASCSASPAPAPTSPG